MSGRFELTREVVIRGIHHLELASLSAVENEALYGMCFRRHGHHYKVQVTISGPLDQDSGLVIDRDRFEEILQRVLIRPFDGADLNKHFSNTSCEALTVEFFKLLEPELPKGSLRKVTIKETRKNLFEHSPFES